MSSLEVGMEAGKRELGCTSISYSGEGERESLSLLVAMVTVVVGMLAVVEMLFL